MISFNNWVILTEQTPNLPPNAPQNPQPNQQSMQPQNTPNNAQNQQPNNKFSAEAKGKRDALKELVKMVTWPSAIQGADTNKKLEKSRSKASAYFSNYLKFINSNSPDAGNNKVFDYLIKIQDPSNFNMLLDPKTFVNAIKLCYQAINLYQQFLNNLEPNSELYPTANKNKDKMVNAYKNIISLNK